MLGKKTMWLPASLVVWLIYQMLFMMFPLWAQEEVPHCSETILVACPKRPCPTVRPCYAKGSPVPGVCCMDIFLPNTGQWGCCQYTSSALQVCVCRDDAGVEHFCVDDLGFPDYTGYCDKAPGWDVADPQFFCCWHGRNKGQCLQDLYDCS